MKTAKDIKETFKLYLDLNKIKPHSKKAHEAQYWFLAGVRTFQHPLPPEIEVLHHCGRSIVTGV